jgi:site-specific DNA-methyltransferase (adenine-specific)
MTYKVINGNNIDVLKTYPNNHFDSIVTDPPYGIDFLGKSWDANTGALETYQQCLRVLKPGGHILAFSAARTYHHLAMTLESAGFEIRDQIMWIYSQGMPKGYNLKPAHEPIALARKPVEESVAKNIIKWGTGALNIDSARIPSETLTYPANGMSRLKFNQGQPDKWTGATTTNDQGRFPSNVLGEIADYQKFFYCPKVTSQERMEFNNHPTVKPIELMKYLIKLITPPGGIVLDPFNGSGSTGCAAVELGFDYVGCELDAKYVDISIKRIDSWCQDQVLFRELFKEE